MNCASVDYPAGYFSTALPTVGRHDRNIMVAVTISLFIHGICLGWLPGLKSPLAEVSPRLDIRLSPPLAQSEPEPTPSAPIAAPAPKTIRHESDLPTRETQPIMTNPAAQGREDAPSVSSPGRSVTNADETPPPSLPSNTLPTKRLDADVLAAYGRELAGTVAAHQRYPRVALLRQWQGSVLLQLEFGGDGKLFAVRVLSSSGYEILDRQALDMVREAAPQLPAALAGRPLTVDVPVVFRITS
jgi:protein TonB